MVAKSKYLDHLLGQMIRKETLDITEINAIGSRKAGKTMAIAELIVKAFIVPDIKIKAYVFRKDVNSVKDSVFEELVIQFQNHDFVPYINLTNTSFKNGVGRGADFIRCKGLAATNQKRAKLTGMAGNSMFDYVIVWFEEAYEFEEKDVLDVMEAIRGAKQILTIYSTNPWTITNWYIGRANEKVPFDESIMMATGNQLTIVGKKLYHYTNWRINEFLEQTDKDQLLQLEKDNPVRARVASFGLPGIETGSIYAPYIHHISRLIPKSSFYQGGVDFGYRKDATALMVIGHNPDYKVLNVVGEYYHSNAVGQFKTMDIMVNDIINKLCMLANSSKHSLISRGIIIYCDTSNWPVIEWLNRVAYERHLLWMSFKPCKKISIEHRTGFKIQMISNNRVNVDIECVNFMRELELAQWDTTKAKLTPMDKDNHTLDALDY